MDPEITVLMSVYNGERFLMEAIESILNQTYRDFEFLIINDGSTDSSREIILSYNDPRIRLIDNEQNMGLTRSLNKGLRLARGNYIARMDADDISMPERLERQLGFMERNPDIGLLGSWIEAIDIYGNILYKLKLPETDAYIKWTLLFENCIVHSSAFYKRDLSMKLDGYNEQFKRAQDYDLWSKMSFVTSIYQIPEVLLKLRDSSDSQKTCYIQDQEKTVRHVLKYSLSKTLGRDIPLEQINEFRRALKGEKIDDINNVLSLILYVFKLFRSNVELSKEEKTLIYSNFFARIFNIYKFNKRIYIELLGIVKSDRFIFNIFLYFMFENYFRYYFLGKNYNSSSVWNNKS